VRQSNTYTFLFVSLVAVIAALILSVASQSLKERQVSNIEADMKKNILSAVGLMKTGICNSEKQDIKEKCSKIKCCYDENIKSFVVNSEGIRVSGDYIPERINIENEMDKPESERLYPVFVRMEKGEVLAYCIPIVGKGLWSTLYGYMALEKDLNTVKGVTFYKHAETPGLGAEIERDWFLDNYKGKKILSENGVLMSVSTVKGKADPASLHEVDGISGATLTCHGVNSMIKNNLMIFEPYFKRIRRNNQ